MENLIGRKVKGFKFDGDKYSQIGYDSDMDECVDCVGEIITHFETDKSYLVEFEDNTWCYPAELIEQHLID